MNRSSLLSSLSKRFCAIFCAFVVALASMSVPVFADVSSFSDQPLPVSNASDGATIISTGLYVYDQIVSSSLTRHYYAVSVVEDTYAFVANGQLRFATPFVSKWVRTAYDSAYNGTQWTMNNYDETYDLYYSGPAASGASFVFDVPSYSTLADGLAAVRNYIETQGASPYASSFSVPAGWVAYYRSVSTATIKCYQPVSSTWLGGSNQWSEGGQKYGYSASLPTSSTTFPLGGMSLIPWEKGFPRMANGNTRNSVSTISATPRNQWTVVYNPLLTNYYTETAGDDLPNGTIEIVVTGLAEVRLYPLSVAVVDGVVIGTSNDGYEDPAIGVIDPDTGSVSFEDSEGNVVVPNVGGQNYTPEDISVQGFFDRVLQALNDLISGIGNLFGFAFEAIANLVSLAGPFFGKLATLYSWLPQPVMSALSSAMILAITIGVLKSFL